jgi:cobalt-zinc-cadmium resistance protein CzcA
MKRIFLYLLYAVVSQKIAAQTFSLSQAFEQALQHSPYLKSASLDVERHAVLKRAAPGIPKTDVQLLYGQYNSIERHDNNLTISQTLPFPTTIARQVQHAKAGLAAAEYRNELSRQELLFEVKQTYFGLLYLKARIALMLRQDSLMQALSTTATLRFKTGDATLLEKTTAETQQREARNQVQRVQNDFQIALHRLAALLNSPVDDVHGALYELEPVLPDSTMLRQSPALKHSRQQVQVAERWQALQQSFLLPDIRIGYFNQTLIGTQTVNGVETTFGSDKRFQGFQIGLTVPLWFFNLSASAQAAQLAKQMAVQDAEQTQLQLTGRWLQAVDEMEKSRANLNYYKEQALPGVQLLNKQNIRSYQTGEITYTTFLLNAQQVLRIEEAHLAAVNDWNQSIVRYEFLTGTIDNK